MHYTERLGKRLSPDAARAFENIAQGLIDKITREGTIPETYRFWTLSDYPQINRELMKRRVIRHAFTDEKGVEVYEHQVDAEAIRAVLGLDKH